MAKLTLTDESSGFQTTTQRNANYTLIETALENTLSRDGTTPNAMGANLDMNSNRVINLPAPVANSDAARWVDVASAIGLDTAVPNQSGNGGKVLTTNGTALVWRNAALAVATVADMKATTDALTTGTRVTVLGYYTAGDFGGGEFIYDSASAATADDGLIFTPTNLSGRFIRLLEGPINVKMFGAKADGVTTDTTAVQAAIDAVNAAGGGDCWAPRGTYAVGALTMRIKVRLYGDGPNSTIFKSSHTGHGLKMTSAINASTAVYTSVENIQLWNTNGSNTGGGYVDVGGTFVTLKKLNVIGFKHSGIFDQTELADVEECLFQSPLTSWFWLVNDASFTPTALSSFTNRISFYKNQFNGTAGAVLDDGGYAHSFTDNNFNGGGNHIRACATNGLKINGGEYESASSTIFLFSDTSWQGASLGTNLNLDIGGGAVVIPTLGQSCIQFLGGGHSAVSIGNVVLGNTSAVKILGTSNVGVLNVTGPIQNSGGGATFDGLATYHTELGLAGKIYLPPTAWTPTDNSGAGLSLTISNANYQKVGTRIFGEASITYPVTVSVANALIGGFPATSGAGGIHGHITYTDVAPANMNFISGGAGTSVGLLVPGSNVTNATMSGKTIKFTFQYFV